MKKRARELNPRKQTLISNLSKCSATSLIKHLASCNDTVRFQALRLLQTWLTTTSESPKPEKTTQMVSDSDMKKIWKGLFYCLWHCDKAPAQAELINRMSSLVLRLGPVLSVQYFEGFVVMLRREWTGIDHLRLDKFYLCIRRFVKAVFGFVAKWGWDLGLLGKFVDVLEFHGFFADDELLGHGVCYHVVGVFLDELRGCFVPVRKEVVDLVFRPFFRVMERSLDKVLIGKVRGLVFEELLKIGGDLLGRKRDGEEAVYDDVAFGLIAMKMGFAARFYEIGSSADCVQGNRKVVLKLHEEFLKLEERLESSGIEIEIPDVVLQNDDEEIPELIPIESSERNGGLDQIEMKVNDRAIDANGEAEEGEDMIDDVEDARKHKKARRELDGSRKKVKTKKRKEKNNQPLDENSSVQLACAPVTKTVVEASVKHKSKSSDKKRKKKEKENGVDTNVSEASLSAPVDMISVKEVSSSCEQENNVLNESVIANLQKQFENVAAELGSDEDGDDFSLSEAFASICNRPTMKKKKKRAKRCDTQSLVSNGDGGDSAVVSTNGSEKKVRFAMKDNLVWKPHSPLPPQSLRIPPSVTPRGSALKKGVLPGPIREVPPAKKKLKKKKARKTLKKIVHQ